MSHGAQRYVLVGGGGFVGSHLGRGLIEAGHDVTVVDRVTLTAAVTATGVHGLARDLLCDDPDLPEGHVVILLGASHPRPRWPWTLALDNAMATARILPSLRDREVTLVSSVEVYGGACGPLRESTPPRLPLSEEELGDWVSTAGLLGRRRCDPWRVAGHCRALVDADPSGRWAYGLSKRAQELLLAEHAAPAQLRVLRLGNLFGVGQHRVVANLVRRALLGGPLAVRESTRRSLLPVEDVTRVLLHDLSAGVYNVGHAPITLRSLAERICELTGCRTAIDALPEFRHDTCGEVTCEPLSASGFVASDLEDSIRRFVDALRPAGPPFFDPPLQVVLPPRSPAPDRLADHQQHALWHGRVKHGQRWSKLLTDRLSALTKCSQTLITTSGTEALRLAVAGTAGPARSGDIALLPSFTFPATAEVLVQLGYALRFVDVDADNWTLDPAAVQRAIRQHPRARVVVCVDTFGNPCDYGALTELCAAHRLPLVADSAASLGGRWADAPIGTQADAHAFSMSFAKVVSAAGAGGAVTFREPPRLDPNAGWTRSALMDELHAIAAVEQLELLPELISRRESVAAIYARSVRSVPQIRTQKVARGARHSQVHWVMQVSDGPSSLRNCLDAAGIQSRDYFRALHLAPGSPPSPDLPVTERLHDEVCALPMSSELTTDQAECVALALAEALQAVSSAVVPSCGHGA